VDVQALVKDAESRWRARLEEDGCAFEVDAPELPPVRGDREALLRAVGNLLDNARKYARAPKRVALAARADDDSVRVTVRDSGPGIPVGERARVLRPFTRAETADRKETPGAGLGLSLVAACMEAHGGSVEVADGITLVLPRGGK
jgi:signal transduction histidine kinase